MSLLKPSILRSGSDKRMHEGDNTAVEASVGTGLRAAAAHRIRIGLTGLAAIFLVVLIAAAGLRPSQSMAAADTGAEPLAVLGVAPGAAPGK